MVTQRPADSDLPAGPPAEPADSDLSAGPPAQPAGAPAEPVGAPAEPAGAVPAGPPAEPAVADPAAGGRPDAAAGAEPSAEPAPVAARSGLRPTAWIKWIFLAVVLTFGGIYVAHRWHELVTEFRQMSVLAVLASMVLAAMAQVAAMRAYRTMLADLGAPLPVPAVGRLYFIGQLGKYLPGSVWVFVGIMTLGRELGIMRKTSLATTMAAFALSIATALGVGAVLLPLSAAGSVRRFWYLGLLLPVLVVGLTPRVFGWALDLVLRLARKDPMPARLTGGGMLRATGWQLLGWLLFGLHAWVLVIGIGGPVGGSLLVSIGGFALAWGIGPLAVIAPAGAGVRETGLVLTLGTVIGGTAALAVALVSRVALIVVDFAQAGSWTLRARRNRRLA
ncbi:MAG: glycosyltransferase 2 family protein [Mycobacteriales bacterium]